MSLFYPFFKVDFCTFKIQGQSFDFYSCIRESSCNLWKDFIIAIIIMLLLDALSSQIILFVLIHISIDFYLPLYKLKT